MHVGGCRYIPQRPAQGWLYYDAWREEEGSMERINSCPGELSEPEGTKRENQ